ncbi:DUF2177 family protein [Novosphingobium sp. FSW06-99]|uniref:DUF2177 family protein n=1 Tax=Novosphingobium sp. FSW06-99 TaxID=1739113 RepID=UPI00076CA16D|nr:DUF2177 family protein [Novosphingobium sp. FSW06-99]KUR77709.1 hypothetical protein AQZ49_09455 [Novosphingobium sp. FSW06-99]
MKWLIGYTVAALAFGALDACWLTFAGSRIYRPVLGDLLAADFRGGPAVLFYLVYLAGITWFAIRPGLADGVGTAALNAALLGGLCYATYDLTNQATLARWPAWLSAIDIAWGSFATAVAAVVATAVTRKVIGGA